MIERLMLERFASPRIQLPDDEHEAHNDHWDLADENQPRDASSGAQNLPCHDPRGEEPRAWRVLPDSVVWWPKPGELCWPRPRPCRCPVGQRMGRGGRSAVAAKTGIGASDKFV